MAAVAGPDAGLLVVAVAVAVAASVWWQRWWAEGLSAYGAALLKLMQALSQGRLR